MYLLYVGLTHKESPLSLLEKVYLADQDLPLALAFLKGEKSVLEVVLVSTCHRTELYLVVDQLHTGRYYGKRFLASWFGLSDEQLARSCQFKEEEQAICHLLRVSVGLEAKILGETQILGQLKQAFMKAQEEGATGVVLNHMFRQVLTFAKRMHESYQINARPASLGLTAIQELDHQSFDYQDKQVLVLGLGQIGQLVTKYVLKRPFARIYLCNRTLSKASPFLLEERVSAHAWSDFPQLVAKADVIFSAVKVEQAIIEPGMAKPDALIFDLCLPRTVDRRVSQRLYNLDDLTNQLDGYQAERQQIAGQIDLEIEQELVAFQVWRQSLGVIPVIRDLREKALGAKEAALMSLERKLPHLTQREKKVIDKHMKGIVNQLIKEPILQIKELSVGERAADDLALVRRLFGLREESEGEDEKD